MSFADIVNKYFSVTDYMAKFQLLNSRITTQLYFFSHILIEKRSQIKIATKYLLLLPSIAQLCLLFLNLGAMIFVVVQHA